jgi:hypothetical protein
MSNQIQPKHSPHPQVLRRLRLISHVLDNAIPIPGTNYRIGIDPILGLLPGAGDVVGSALSTYIVFEAARFGLPRETLIRMVGNILFETFTGSVPVLGDVVDATWKANMRNLALLETHLSPNTPTNQRPSRKADVGFIVLLVIGFILLTIGILTVTGFLIGLLLQAINR